jgi:hypothetical protein
MGTTDLPSPDWHGTRWNPATALYDSFRSVLFLRPAVFHFQSSFVSSNHSLLQCARKQHRNEYVHLGLCCFAYTATFPLLWLVLFASAVAQISVVAFFNFLFVFVTASEWHTLQGIMGLMMDICRSEGWVWAICKVIKWFTIRRRHFEGIYLDSGNTPTRPSMLLKSVCF